MVDSENQCWPVMVYNMAVGAGFAVGDSLAIPEPFCQETDFTENEQVISSHHLTCPSVFVCSTTIQCC